MNEIEKIEKRIFIIKIIILGYTICILVLGILNLCFWKIDLVDEMIILCNRKYVVKNKKQIHKKERISETRLFELKEDEIQLALLKEIQFDKTFNIEKVIEENKDCLEYENYPTLWIRKLKRIKDKVNINNCRKYQSFDIQTVILFNLNEKINKEQLEYLYSELLNIYCALINNYDLDSYELLRDTEKILKYNNTFSQKDLVNIYLRLGEIYLRLKKYRKSFFYLEKVFYLCHRSEKKIYSKYLVLLTNRLEFIYPYLSKDKDISKRVIKIFVTICDEQNQYQQYIDIKTIITFNLAIGYYYFYYNSYQDSLKYYQRIVNNKVFLSDLNSRGKIQLFSSLIIIYKKLGKKRKEEEILKRLIEIYKNSDILKEKMIQIVLCFRLARLYEDFGELKKSLQVYENIYSLVKNLDTQKIKLSKILLNIAFAYIELEKYELAKLILNEILCKEKDPILVANANKIFGILYFYNKKYSRALMYLNKAERGFIEYKDMTKNIDINMLKSLIYSQLKYRRLYFYCLNKSLFLFKKIKKEERTKSVNINRLVNIYFGFSKYYFDTKRKTDLKKSISYLLKAKDIAQKNDILLLDVLNNLVIRYIFLYDITKIKIYLEEIKNLKRKFKTKMNICKYYEIMGKLNLGLGEFNRALENFLEIKKIDPNRFFLNFNIAQICDQLEQYNEAIYYYKLEAAKLERKSVFYYRYYLSKIYTKILNSYLNQNMYKEGYKYFLKIQKLYPKEDLEYNPNMFIALDKLESKFVMKKKDSIYYKNRLKKLIKYYKKNLVFNNCFCDEYFILKIADLYFEQSKLNKALKYYKKVLEVSERTKHNGIIIRSQLNIGLFYFLKKNYLKSINYLKKNIKLIKKERLQLVRFDKYINSYIKTCLLLSLIYTKQGLLKKAYYYSEILKDVLNKNDKLIYLELVNLQKLIRSDTTMIIYGETGSNKNYKLFIEKGKLYGKLYNLDLENIILDNCNNISSKELLFSNNYKQNFLNAVVYYYCDCLKRGKTKYLDIISSKLNEYLIDPIKESVKKKSLVIVSDIVLGPFPFETLVTRNRNGGKRYLIEDYKVSYIQSAKTYVYLSRPKPKYKKNILALGNIQYKNYIYNNNKYITKIVGPRRNFGFNEYQLLVLLEQIKKGIFFGEILKNFENDLNSCDNLLCSDRILEEIEKYPNTKTYKGKEVTLKKLQELSKTGELEKYKIIHFGAHGIIFPAVPELSGIVLSSNDKAISPLNNYLHVNRILKLKLKADLVVLAVCHSSVEKITSEGLNGLIEAFMRVGARNVLVTLWKVYDEYTYIFMKKFYELHYKHPEWSYSKVLREVKLMSIRGELGELYKSPCFWGAYVLYGRD